MSNKKWFHNQKAIAQKMVSIGNQILADLSVIEEGGSIVLTPKQKSERLSAARELDKLNTDFRKEFGLERK